MKHIEAYKIPGAIKSFEQFGCRHNDIGHSVPVIIDQTVLDIVLSGARLPTAALFNVGEVALSENGELCYSVRRPPSASGKRVSSCRQSMQDSSTI